MFKLLLRVKKNLSRYFAHKQSNITVLHNLQFMKKAFAVLLAVVMLAMAILPGMTTVNAEDPPIPISGKVLDDNGAILTDVVVTIEVENEGVISEKTQNTLTDGTFSISLDVGDIAKRIKFGKIDGSNVYYVSMTNLVRSAANDWWFTLERDPNVGTVIMGLMSTTKTVNLAGIVSDSGGTPLKDVVVKVYPKGGTAPATPEKTATDGTFTYTDLNAFTGTEGGKTYAVYVVEFESTTHSVSSATGLEKVGNNKFEVSMVRSTDVTVTMSSEHGVISGTILGGSSGEATKLDGVTVALYLEGSDVELRSTMTKSGGLFEFTGLEPGTYVIKFNHDPYSLYAVSDGTMTSDGRWKVNLEERMNALIVMNRTTGDLIVNVVNQDGNPLGGVTIDVIKDGKVVKSGQTDGSGTYRVTIDKGVYSVSANRTNYDGQTDEIVVIDPNEPVEIEFTLTLIMNTYLFGLDLPHSLMIGGLGLGIVIILVMLGYRIKLGKSES